MEERVMQARTIRTCLTNKELTKRQQGTYRKNKTCFDFLPIGFTVQRVLNLNFYKKITIRLACVSQVTQLHSAYEHTRKQVHVKAWTSKTYNNETCYTIQLEDESNPPSKTTIAAAAEDFCSRNSIATKLKSSYLFGYQCHALQEIFDDLNSRSLIALDPKTTKRYVS